MIYHFQIANKRVSKLAREQARSLTRNNQQATNEQLQKNIFGCASVGTYVRTYVTFWN